MTIMPGQSAPEMSAIFVRYPASPVTRIVVGVDGSADSAAALWWAAAEACRGQAVLRIVSAWEESGQSAFYPSGHPAQVAARRVQKALTQVLGQPHYPRHIACATPEGTPGETLLREAGDTGLLVLGMKGASAAQAPGPTCRYCLQHGGGPLVFVPVRPFISASPLDSQALTR
jgi:nucleotide-binding universal stress UspA family protein